MLHLQKNAANLQFSTFFFSLKFVILLFWRHFCIQQYCAFLFPDLLKRRIFSEIIEIWQITCFSVLPWSHLPSNWWKTKFYSKTNKCCRHLTFTFIFPEHPLRVFKNSQTPPLLFHKSPQRLHPPRAPPRRSMPPKMGGGPPTWWGGMWWAAPLLGGDLVVVDHPHGDKYKKMCNLGNTYIDQKWFYMGFSKRTFCANNQRFCVF